MCQGHAVDPIVGGGATSAYWAGVPLMIKGRGAHESSSRIAECI